MFISLKTLLHLPVYTESGTHLGRVHDLELDIDSHHVRHYIVEPRFFGKEYYLVTPVQIKSVTAEKIIVEDTIIKVEKSKEEKGGAPQPALGDISPSMQK